MLLAIEDQLKTSPGVWGKNISKKPAGSKGEGTFS